MSVKGRILDKARALGFDAVGVARADEPLGLDHDRYLQFVDRGFHGSMDWLAENREVRARLDRDSILAGARSVICVARRYARPDEPTGLARGIARYARGHDYHNGLRKKLRRLAAFVRAQGEGVVARPMVDDVPVLERAWARRSGLGFVGKNGLVIVPGQGSLVLLGEVVTTLALEPDEPMNERCGSCTRCLDACPTDAFAAPFVLDARRCISYLTIESRAVAPSGLQPGIGDHLFGCDDCQTVCPFNATKPPPADRTAPFAALDRWAALDLADVLASREADWPALAEGTPVHRATWAGFVRNALIVARNERRTDLVPRVRAIAASDAHPPMLRALAADVLRDLLPREPRRGTDGP